MTKYHATAGPQEGERTPQPTDSFPSKTFYGGGRALDFRFRVPPCSPSSASKRVQRMCGRRPTMLTLPDRRTLARPLHIPSIPSHLLLPTSLPVERTENLDTPTRDTNRHETPTDTRHQPTDLLTHPGDVGGCCLDLLTLVQHAPVEVDLYNTTSDQR